MLKKQTEMTTTVNGNTITTIRIRLRVSDKHFDTHNTTIQINMYGYPAGNVYQQKNLQYTRNNPLHDDS